VFQIPQAMVRNVPSMVGSEGQAWLDQLPGLLRELSKRWGISIDAPFPDVWFNYVAPARRRDGSRAVLKVGFPHPELFTEIDALRLYNGRGAVQILEIDEEKAAFLLERLEPGKQLSSLEDDAEATRIAAAVMRQLRPPIPRKHRFPTVADWANRGFRKLRAEFDGGTGPFPRGLVEEAEMVFAELLPSMAEAVVLHGDLHHGNILSAHRAPWLTIDPKGVVGEPAYETGSLLRNPFPQLLDYPDVGRVLSRRIDILAHELGFERERIRRWGLAQAVLSAWWSFEDQAGSWQYGIRVGEILSGLV
jgi:streptomycin 6-kinase